MKDDLVVPYREVVDAVPFGEAIRLQVMPFMLPQVPLLKADMDDDKLQPVLLHLPRMLFPDFRHLKDV